MDNIIDKRFLETFCLPFSSRLKKDGIEIRDKRGPVCVLRTGISEHKHDADLHDDIIRDFVKMLNMEDPKWFGIEKYCHSDDIAWGFEFGPLELTRTYDAAYSITTLNEVLIPFIAFHAFKGTISYATFIQNRYYNDCIPIFLLCDSNQKLYKHSCIKHSHSCSFEDAIEDELNYLKKVTVVEYILQNRNIPWTESMVKTVSKELMQNLRMCVYKYFSKSFKAQREKDVRTQYIDSIFEILKGFPLTFSMERIKDIREDMGFYDQRVKQYYSTLFDMFHYVYEHQLDCLDIECLPVDIKNSIWAFAKPEYMQPGKVEFLKYYNHRDETYHRVFRKYVFTKPDLLNSFWEYYNKYNLNITEFGIGLPFECPTKKRTQKDISEYVSACLLVMGVKTMPSTIGKLFWEYNYICKDIAKRGIEPPDKVEFFCGALKNLFFDWDRQLVNDDARHDFTPDEEFTRKLFLMDD